MGLTLSKIPIKKDNVKLVAVPLKWLFITFKCVRALSDAIKDGMEPEIIQIERMFSDRYDVA